jgi:hypothetical protein
MDRIRGRYRKVKEKFRSTSISQSSSPNAESASVSIDIGLQASSDLSPVRRTDEGDETTTLATLQAAKPVQTALSIDTVPRNEQLAEPTVRISLPLHHHLFGPDLQPGKHHWCGSKVGRKLPFVSLPAMRSQNLL